MEYRNDLEAARLRINTLEAKLEESKAALDAREAELAECRMERDRLRQTASGQTAPSKWPYVAVGIVALIIGAGLGFSVGFFVTAAPAMVQPAATPPQPTVVENGPHAEGHIVAPPPEKRAPAANVSGQTNAPEPDVTIDSVVQDSRSKVVECYREEEKHHAKVSGSFNVVFDIETNGKASGLKYEPLPFLEPWWSKNFEKCVEGVYKNLTFPNQSGSKTRAKGSYFLSAIDLSF